MFISLIHTCNILSYLCILLMSRVEISCPTCVHMHHKQTLISTLSSVTIIVLAFIHIYKPYMMAVHIISDYDINLLKLHCFFSFKTEVTFVITILT